MVMFSVQLIEIRLPSMVRHGAELEMLLKNVPESAKVRQMVGVCHSS